MLVPLPSLVDSSRGCHDGRAGVELGRGLKLEGGLEQSRGRMERELDRERLVEDLDWKGRMGGPLEVLREPRFRAVCG